MCFLKIYVIEDFCHNRLVRTCGKFLSPPVHFARWAHMHRFLSVRLSVRLSVWTRPKIRLEKNSYLKKYYRWASETLSHYRALLCA